MIFFLVIEYAGNKEDKAVINIENKKIIIIDDTLISLGIFSKI